MTTTTLQTEHRAHVAFYLTGTRIAGALQDVEALRPALFAPYSDLTRLRYDFPVVLLRAAADTPFEPLSRIVDRLLARLAPAGTDRRRVRMLLFRHEAAMRKLVAGGENATLGELWDLAADAGGYDEAAAAALGEARAALECDGQVLDCNSAMLVRLFVHAWRYAQQRKTEPTCAELERLELRLSDILKADFAASPAARTPAKLEAAVGTAFENAFDFGRMSSLLDGALPRHGLEPARRSRIERVLNALRSQRFFSRGGAAKRHTHEPYGFVYTSAFDTEKAWRQRMPEAIELAKAMAIGALEASGEYDEAQHDAVFEGYGANGLPAEELARFPDYLLWLHAPAGEDLSEVTALLSGGAPVKVLVQLDDLLEASADGRGDFTLGLRSRQLAEFAMGLSDVYVLQAAASHLVHMRERIVKGLACAGPALFSVYSGASGADGLPPYLMSAAAMECRAFPAFTYDPSAGAGWAERFSVESNPQPERDWPVQTLAFEDPNHEHAAAQLEFTLADFMACDPRYARHCAKVPAAACNNHLVSVREWLAQPSGAAAERVPAVTMIDRENVLQRVLVDAKAIEETKRCQAIWRSLQELGGIHNSHAERLLAHSRAAWEEEKRQALEALARTAQTVVEAPASVAAAAAEATAAATAPPAEEKPADEAYIETPRCTTCEECVRINGTLFAYDANKQAYIADALAGTYRQLVEAAEACQVSIIHPGKPRNRDEPGLEELMRRAEPFR